MQSGKRLFSRGLIKAVILSTIVALVGIAIIHIRGIENNAEAVSWAVLFFSMVAIFLIEHVK